MAQIAQRLRQQRGPRHHVHEGVERTRARPQAILAKWFPSFDGEADQLRWHPIATAMMRAYTTEADAECFDKIASLLFKAHALTAEAETLMRGRDERWKRERLATWPWPELLKGQDSQHVVGAGKHLLEIGRALAGPRNLAHTKDGGVNSRRRGSRIAGWQRNMIKRIIEGIALGVGTVGEAAVREASDLLAAVAWTLKLDRGGSFDDCRKRWRKLVAEEWSLAVARKS